MKIITTTAAALLALGALTACGERDEPIEENVEAAGDDLGDAMDDAGDEIGEFGDDAVDTMEDAGDDFGDAMDDAGDEIDEEVGEMDRPGE